MKRFFGIAVFVILLDQLTKYLITAGLSLNESFVLIKNFLSITYITNTGAGFGILKGANGFLIALSFIVFAALFYYRNDFKNDVEKQMVALIVGGIIGNLIDRILLGHVIDFISFSFWPAFNVADSALTIGILGLILYNWKE